MADWYGTARSNYFHVKDKEAFEEHCNHMELNVWDDRKDGRVGVCPRSDDSGWPSEVYLAENTPEKVCKELGVSEDYFWEFDVQEEIAKHLADGEVCVLLTAGAEKLRYISGHAAAFNSKNEARFLSLDDIYERAKELTDRPDDISLAEH